MTINKWGGIASFFLAISVIVAPMIYLSGNTRDALGVFGYGVADFLSGPLLAACLVTVTFVLRERIGQAAPRRMNLALLAAVLSAAGFAAVAFIRASNRQYHVLHPGLHLEDSTTVLIVWTTLVAGVNAFAFHFLGWVFVLLGASTWKSRLFPRLLTIFHFLAGAAALFVYLLPELEGFVLLIGVITSIWLGILFWRKESGQSSNTTLIKPG